MLFVIGSSVASRLEKNDPEAIDCINSIIDSRKRGLILIYASKSTSKKIGAYLFSNGRQRDAELFKAISRKFREKKALIRKLSIFVFITGKSISTRIKSKKIIKLSPEKINRSNTLYPPLLLAENLVDCDLYGKVIAEKYTATIPQELGRIKIYQRPTHGGGNSTHTVYSRYKKSELDFCFCIVDSDRKCPEEKNGDTASFLESAHNTGAPSVLCDYLVIDTYSAENLLPIDLIRSQFSKNKNDTDVKEFEKIERIRELKSWKYLPLKKGISGKNLREKTGYSKFWRQEIEKVELSTICCEKLDCTCQLIPKIPSKTLENAVENHADWGQQINDEINSDIKNMYENISKTLRSWLCVGQEIRVS